MAKRAGADFFDAGIAVHRALCAGELVAESDREAMIPRGVWLSIGPADLFDRRGYWEFDGLRYGNPTLTTEAVDHWLAQAADREDGPRPVERQIAPTLDDRTSPAAKIVSDANAAAPLPPYVRFVVDIAADLANVHQRKIEDIEAEIRARWPSSLPPHSNRLVSAMATMLRPPEAQRGGAKPMRVAGNAVSRERFNGLTPGDEWAADIVAKSG